MILYFLQRIWWVLFIAIIAIIVFFPGYSKLEQLNQKNKELNHRIVELKRENVSLKTNIEKLKNDPFYLEKVAREKMGVVKKGEVVYKIVPQDKQ
ncbi:MAG: septum formation initiator family protein [Candidatus Omnitrophota bacterium]